MSKSNKEDYLDEIDLCQYIKIFFKSKKLLFGITLLSALCAIVINISKPKEFQANAVIILDTITNTTKEESAKTLELTQAHKNYSRNNKQELNNTPIKIVAENIPNTNLIYLKVSHTDAKVAFNTCNSIAETFVSERKKSYAKGIEMLNKEIQDIETRKYIISEEMVFLREKIKQQLNTQIPMNTTIPIKSPDTTRLPKESEENKINAFLSSLINYENIYTLLDNKKSSLTTKQTSSTEPKIAESISLQKNYNEKDSLKRFFTFILSGLLLGTFFIFFTETCKSNNT